MGADRRDRLVSPGPASRTVRGAALLSFALAVAVAPLATDAAAQTRKPAPAARGRSTPKTAPKTQPGAAADAGAFGATPASAAPVGLEGATPALDGGTVETKTLDGGTQVFKFKELDIEGRLKSPQLVYFLRRVRAEFAAGDLGHRSFLREMSETRKESSF
jgi:hypothetical protein